MGCAAVVNADCASATHILGQCRSCRQDIGKPAIGYAIRGGAHAAEGFGVAKGLAGIGAGAEFLVAQFVEHMPYDNTTVIFQWPIADRFDKIIQDEQWKDIVVADPVYHFNTHQLANCEWWLSSGSSSPKIREYHQTYVQSAQSAHRLKVYQQLVKEILDKSRCKYLFITTPEQDQYSKITHSEIRGNEVQPSTLSHFYFLIEKIIPQLNLHSKLINRLEQILINTTWPPYDPDRQEKWVKIQQDLNQLSK